MIEGLFAVRKARFQVPLEVAYILLVQSFNAQLLRCCRWLFNELCIIYCVYILQDQSHYKLAGLLSLCMIVKSLANYLIEYRSFWIFALL